MWQPCGTSRESQRSLCQLNRKPDTTVRTREESGLACFHMRRGLTPLWKLHRNPRSMSALERKPEVPASAPDEDIGPGTDWRGITRGFSQLTWRLDFPEATWVGPRSPRYNLRGIPIFLPQLEKNRRFYPQREMRSFYAAASQETSHLPFEPWKCSWHPWCNSRNSLAYPSPLERNTEDLATNKKSPVFLFSSWDEGPFPCFVGKGIPALPSHLKRRLSQLDSWEERWHMWQPSRSQCEESRLWQRS